MTNNQKILLGVGAIALAYYFYNKGKGKGKAVSETNPTPNPCKNPDEVPCNNGSGKCYSILAKYKSDPCKIEKEATPYLLNTPKEKEVTYTCKDGSKVTRNENPMQKVKLTNPCMNKGGISRTEEKFLS
jgi:hypothetical protein